MLQCGSSILFFFPEMMPYHVYVILQTFAIDTQSLLGLLMAYLITHSAKQLGENVSRNSSI